MGATAAAPGAGGRGGARLGAPPPPSLGAAMAACISMSMPAWAATSGLARGCCCWPGAAPPAAGGSGMGGGGTCPGRAGMIPRAIT